MSILALRGLKFLPKSHIWTPRLLQAKFSIIKGKQAAPTPVQLNVTPSVLLNCCL
ncbi:MAG: hypothetical protein ACKE51_09460 [Methylococcaceae bacterium]